MGEEGDNSYVCERGAAEKVRGLGQITIII